jgi:hypothetical protein
MNQSHFGKSISLIMVILIFMTTGCWPASSTIPPGPLPVMPDSITVPEIHVRKMETPVYTWKRGAIIFTMDRVGDSDIKGVADKIIRVFAENNAPLDVAVAPPSDVKDRESLNGLIPYLDAGLIDISVDGQSISWLDPDIPDTKSVSTNLESQLVKAREQLTFYFGIAPVACVFPSESLNQDNYRIIQDTGFKILSTRYSKDLLPSNLPVGWSGGVDRDGLYRLPIVGDVNYSGSPLSELATFNGPAVNKEILKSVDKSVTNMGVAVIEIRPEAFLDTDNKAFMVKIQLLNSLIKSSQRLGEIVTFDGWSRARHRILPAYAGGPSIIFRLDDVTRGWHEDTVREIIELFKKNGVPLDLGVISNVNGTDSFEIPWLKQYVDDGTVGISVHGYDWTFYQLDTGRSNLTFEYIRDKLSRARDQYFQYFGVLPVAVTVPTDFYDSAGYKAINAAGYKVFATQIIIEPHPSTKPVDYFGRSDPNGMYRIPTAMDVCQWDDANKTWGDIFDVSSLTNITDFCKSEYVRIDRGTPYYEFSKNICNELNGLGVAAIGIHPSAFTDKDGKPDREKLQKLDTIIKWVKTFAAITTFEQWYNYTSGKK